MRAFKCSRCRRERSSEFWGGVNIVDDVFPLSVLLFFLSPVLSFDFLEGDFFWGCKEIFKRVCVCGGVPMLL